MDLWVGIPCQEVCSLEVWEAGRQSPAVGRQSPAVGSQSPAVGRRSHDQPTAASALCRCRCPGTSSRPMGEC